MGIVREDLIIEQKKIVRLQCYKAVKFAGTPQAACPYGYNEICENCKHCRWLQVQTEKHHGRPLISDHEIQRVPLRSPLKEIPHNSKPVAPDLPPETDGGPQ